MNKGSLERRKREILEEAVKFTTNRKLNSMTRQDWEDLYWNLFRKGFRTDEILGFSEEWTKGKMIR